MGDKLIDYFQELFNLRLKDKFHPGKQNRNRNFKKMKETLSFQAVAMFMHSTIDHLLIYHNYKPLTFASPPSCTQHEVSLVFSLLPCTCSTRFLGSYLIPTIQT